MPARRVSAALLRSVVLIALLVFGTHADRAGAAMQVFDVDETTSTFSTGTVEVNFDAVAYGTGWLPQYTSGTAIIEAATYQADGTVILDLDASTVTLQDLQIGGDVGAYGSGEMQWGIFTLDIIYNVISRALWLNAPVTLPLVGNSFSGTANFEFLSVLDGYVSGLVIDYPLPEHTVFGDGDMPVTGTLTPAGSDLVLDLSASEMQVDLGGAPTITVEINECAVRLITCIFFLETADITITSMIYNDVQMSLTATGPSPAVCGNDSVELGEDCDDGNTANGDCCSSSCHFEPNGSVCDDDGTVCNGEDTCDGAGTCQPGTPLVCDDGEICTDDDCHPVSGCVYTNNTAPCDDGDACTLFDTCAGGSCVGGPPPNCDDGDPCTEDSCNSMSGCLNEPVTGPDADADTKPDSCDNCPFEPNPGQADTGGAGNGSAPDGIGDACQCGDLNADGLVQAFPSGPVDPNDPATQDSDVIRLRSWLADPNGGVFGITFGLDDLDKCAVVPPTGSCDVLDLVVMRRALEAALPPGLEQACRADSCLEDPNDLNRNCIADD